MLDVPLFSLRSLYANGYLIDTRFLEEAKTDNNQGINTGLGLAWDL